MTDITPDDYIDLDEKHHPQPIRLFFEDGSVSWADMPTTKGDWCATLVKWYKGFDSVTDAVLERYDLTREEFTAFRLDAIEIRRRSETDSEFARIMATMAHPPTD